MNSIKPLPKDYPAAHSMDTTWFAVDENGEIGLFETGPEGLIPVPPEMQEWAQSPEPMTQDDHWNWNGSSKLSYRDLKPYLKEPVDLHELMAWSPENFDEVVTRYGGLSRPFYQSTLVFFLFKSREDIPEGMDYFDIFETTHGMLVIADYDNELFKRLHEEGRLQRFWTRSLGAAQSLVYYYEEKWDHWGIQDFHSVNGEFALEPYIPFNTPRLPLTVDDLPRHLRAPLESWRIPNVSFRDREAWSPYETFANCFSHGRWRIYRGADAYTCFPIPNRRHLWDEEDQFDARRFEAEIMSEDEFYPRKYGLGDIRRKRFCASDASGRIAVFNGNPFAPYPAILQSVISSAPWEPTAPWESFLRQYSSSIHAEMLPFDLSGLEEMPEDEISHIFAENKHHLYGYFLVKLKEFITGLQYAQNLLRIPHPEKRESWQIICDTADLLTFANRQGLERGMIERIWHAGFATHWMEYPFGPFTPRRFGFYHYDMSFLHAGPYMRIAVPSAPANIASLSEDLARALNPIPLPNVDFAQMTMIQPMELLDCLSDAPFWFDTALTRVHPTPNGRESLDPARESRILRRARAHYQMIAELDRNP